MLTVSHLTKKIGDKTILTDLSMEIKKGETVSIIGPSGAGKSTFLRCVNFLEIPNEGSIEINQQILQFPDYDKKKLLSARRMTSMVFQQYNLFKNKTAIQNVMEALLTVKRMKKEAASAISLELLRSVGMEGYANAYPRQLSGGQQQRVGIARAAAVDPALMLFDEPTSSLDPESINGILELIKNQHEKGRTMLVVTHEMRFARQISDKIFVMENGRFIENGTAEEIFERPKHQRTQEFLKKIN